MHIAFWVFDICFLITCLKLNYMLISKVATVKVMLILDWDVLLNWMNRDSDKMIFERLQTEFEAARASQTKGSFLFIYLLSIYTY